MSLTRLSPGKKSLKSSQLVNSNTKSKETRPASAVSNDKDLTNEILRWTFRPESTAPCFINDVFNLRDDPKGDFYWLGRVPCRSVRVVGLVVGVVQHDDNTRYSIDDGSGIIECKQSHKSLPPAPRTSGKPTGRKPDVPSIPPPPITDVGAVLRAEGRVFRSRGSRALQVERDGFTIITDPNDEPRHWAEVVRLHKDSYSLEEPFIIPAPPAPSTPSRPPTSQRTSSPATSTIAPSSPTKPFSSPIKPTSSGLPAQPPSPPRLRHPSKLRSRDLTEATFRIYVKHYIDNAPELQYISNLTPTSTPCSSKQALQQTFTVGYLRRVPLLADLARSVVRAERKRRDREARKRQESQNQRPSHSSSNRSTNLPKASSEPSSRKVKRLFIQTIRNLYVEGSIVIWDGPKCVLQSREDISQHSFMWKNDSTTLTDITTQNTTTSSQANDSDIEVSDEDPNEESYIPVFQPHVAEIVLAAMRKLAARALKLKDGEGLVGAELRSSAQPPTAVEILSYLRKADECWANLGEWAVKEALEKLEDEEYVFKAGKGRWALCL